MDGSVEVGGVLLSPEGARPSITPTVSSTSQEMKFERQRYNSKDLLDSSYSDNVGFPTLPRPKAILSLSYGNRSPFHSASLNAVCSPKRRNGRLNDKKLEARHPVAATSIKVTSSQLSRAKSLKQTGTGSVLKSTNGVAKAGSDCNKTESVGVDNYRRSYSVSSGSEISKVMSNRSRVFSRKVLPAEASGGDEMGRSKKVRKSNRSMTFSFGSSSERKKRALGFLGKEKKGPAQDSYIPPDSPILVTRKSKTLPVATDFMEQPGPDRGWKDEKQLLVQRNGVVRAGSYQDISRKTASPLLEHRSRPPNLSLSSSARGYSTPGDDEESPVLMTEYSPAQSSISALSSFRNSPESIYNGSAQYETSGSSRMAPPTPSSKKQSPNPSPSHSSRLDVHSPAPPSDTSPSITPEPGESRGEVQPNGSSSGPSSSSSGHRSSSIKKRYTFCVKPSQDTKQRRWEMREHVVKFLVETEQSYVESLRRILKVYYEPLKRPQAAALVDSSLVGEIFYQIPEICSIHERFLQQLTVRVRHWDPEKKIGDVFVNTFSKCQLMDIYSKFIGNFMRAKANIETAKQAKSMFAKFLEQKARDSEGKLGLDDLLIKPVQRIPRYVLFIKDLLKHTGPSHPDHAPLQKALGELTMLAERFNDRERERERLGHHKELLSSVDGLAQLLSPHSYFIRYDMITEVKGQIQKRDRFLILFSDILVCASSRRKSSSFKRSSMLNLNSVFSEGLKYNIKWHLPLTKTSVGEPSVVSCNIRKLNTLEKMLESLQKDERLLEQLMELSTAISHPHQNLAMAIKDLHAEVRESAVTKKEELESLPLECTRMDLFSYISTTPIQYSIIFPSQKIRQSWEQEFLQAKRTADNEAPPYASVAPPTSPFPAEVSRCTEIEFRNSAIVQSGKIGTVMTCAVEGLSVEPMGGASCLWVCSNDRLRGKVSLISLQSSSSHCPTASANITVSDSPINCITAVPTSLPPLPPPSPFSASLNSSLQPPSSHLPDHTLTATPPNISINYTTSSSSSTSSSPNVYRRRTSSPTHSIGSDTRSAGADNEDMTTFLDGELDIPNLPDSDSNDTSFATNSLSVHSITRVRSNSAPPYPTTEGSSLMVPGMDQWNLSTDSSGTSSLTASLKPTVLKDGCGLSMWLGTEDGQVLIYGAGDNIRSQSSRRVLDFNSAVNCISCVEEHVLVGLENGCVCVFDSTAPSSPRTDVRVGGEAVQCCLSVMEEVWIGCKDAFFRLDLHSHSVKRLCTLPSGQTLQSAVACGNSVWVSLSRSSLLHLLHAPSGEIIASIDCTRPVMDVLKSYSPIIRQHKSSLLQVTALQLAPSHLVVGTSAGIVLAVPLPFVEPSLEAYTLVDLPVPTPLYQGHVDTVHFLSVAKEMEETLVITGGNGCEDLFKAGMSPEIPETASCVLVWSVKQ